jgi:hypothetical protein
MQRRYFGWPVVGTPDPFQKFTEQEDIAVVRVDEAANGTVVFFEMKEHLLSDEMFKLNFIQKTVPPIEADPGFAKLTNKRQRELYLFEQYSLNSADASDVIEYIAMKKKVSEP